MVAAVVAVTLIDLRAIYSPKKLAIYLKPQYLFCGKSLYLPSGGGRISPGIGTNGGGGMNGRLIGGAPMNGGGGKNGAEFGGTKFIKGEPGDSM